MAEVLAADATEKRDRDPVLELLGHSTQQRLKAALADAGFDKESLSEPETLAALALLAIYPPTLRNGLLVIVQSQDPIRAELTACELVTPVDEQGLDWTMSERGESLLTALADALPNEPVDAPAGEDEDLRRRIDDAQAIAGAAGA